MGAERSVSATPRPHAPGTTVTLEEADALLAYDLGQVAAAIAPLIFAPLDDNAFDALVSFAFSVGVEAFRGSEVRRRLNEGAPLQAAAALELWRRAEIEGEDLVVDALVCRRSAEKALFLTPSSGFRAAPSSVVRAKLDRALLTASHADAWLAAVIAQPPATDVVAALGGEATTSRGDGVQIDSRRSPDARGKAVEALTEKLDALLAERGLGDAVVDEPPPPAIVVQTAPYVQPLPTSDAAVDEPSVEAPSRDEPRPLFAAPRARRRGGALFVWLLISPVRSWVWALWRPRWSAFWLGRRWTRSRLVWSASSH